MAGFFPYSMAVDSAWSGLIDVHSDSFKILLLTAYTPDQDAHQFVSDVLGAGTELGTSPYAAGGLALSSVVWTQDGGSWTLDCANPTWGSGALSAAYAVVADVTPGSDATNPVVAYADFGGTVTLNPFTVTVNASGLFVAARV